MSVGHEVHRHPRAPIELGMTAKEVRISGFKTICEAEVVLKNKIGIVEKVHHQRSIGDGEVTRRLRAAAVEVLVPGVERNGEEAAGLPFERTFLAIALPYH